MLMFCASHHICEDAFVRLREGLQEEREREREKKKEKKMKEKSIFSVRKASFYLAVT